MYAQIEIVAPNSAGVGELVPLTIKVKNIWDYQFATYVEVLYDSEAGFESPDRWVYPGETIEFDGSFTMPDKGVTIYAYSYVEDEEGYWARDASKYVKISLEGEEIKKFPLLPVALVGAGLAMVVLAKR